MKLQAFDAYAASYDSDFTHAAIGRLQRREVWHYLKPLITAKSLKILEINCGTGEDAIQLSQMGHQVTATDASVEMIRVCKAKQREEVTFLEADFLTLPSVLADAQFDLIFSNFGGLNCVDSGQTSRIAATLQELLRPNGFLFVVYMSSACWWERFYFRYKGEGEKAKRRQQQGPVKAIVLEEEIDIWYYSPRQLENLFAPYFQVQSVHPIGLFVPPSYLEDIFVKRPRILRWLYRLDQLFTNPRWANSADHFAMIFQSTRT